MSKKGGGKSVRWIREHVAYSGDDCLMWPFGRCNGYGTLGHEGSHHYAHRMMCELAHGPAPDGCHASHSCGRGHEGCVNPKHLSWKTVSENQRDRRVHGTKGNGPVGKLDEQKVKAIRLLAGKMPQRELAEIFGVSRSQISWVVTGKVWRDDRQRARAVPRIYSGGIAN